MHKLPTVRETVGAEVYTFDSFEGMTLVVGLIINGHCNEANPHQKVKALELKWEVNGGDHGDACRGGWRLFPRSLLWSYGY